MATDLDEHVFGVGIGTRAILRYYNKKRSREQHFVFSPVRLLISFMMRRTASYNVGQILRGRNASYTIETQLCNRPEGPWLATYRAPFIASCVPLFNLYWGSESAESCCQDRPFEALEQ